MSCVFYQFYVQLLTSKCDYHGDGVQKVGGSLNFKYLPTHLISLYNIVRHFLTEDGFYDNTKSRAACDILATSCTEHDMTGIFFMVSMLLNSSR